MQKETLVCVIGGGPAGMMAAATAASTGARTILFEKNQLKGQIQLGRKLLITGNGRCNVTNNSDTRNLIDNVVRNGKFLYSAFNSFTPADVIQLLKKYGVMVKEEDRGRIFPESNRSKDVVAVFKQYMLDNNVKLINAEVIRVKATANNQFEITYKKASIINSNETNDNIDNYISNNIDESISNEFNVFKQGRIIVDRVVIATGGKSFPQTGSTGDGHTFANQFGHTITPLRASQVPIELAEQQVRELQGLSFKDVKVSLAKLNLSQHERPQSEQQFKIVFEDTGDIMFTHFGITGPVILAASAHVKDNISDKYQITIDFMPNLTDEEIDRLLLDEINQQGKKYIVNILLTFLPKKLIMVLLKDIKICYDVYANQISKENRRKIICLIKKYSLTVRKLRPLAEAVITSGGIDTSEIDSKTMNSKLVDGLSFAGEIIDVDANTGGYNIQIALSTGYLAGINLLNY